MAAKAQKTKKKTVAKKSVKKARPAKAVTKKVAPKTVIKKKAIKKKSSSTARSAQAKTKTNRTTQSKETETMKPLKFDKIAQDAGKAGQEQTQVYMESCNVFAKGMESIMQANTSFIQNFAEKQMKYMNDAMQVKTLEDFTKTQNEIAQENFNDLMAQATQSSKQCTQLTTEFFEPLNEELTKAVQKASKAA